MVDYKIENGKRVPYTPEEIELLLLAEREAEAEEIRRKQEEYEASLITDDAGNKYEQIIVNGALALKLVESADGTLNI